MQYYITIALKFNYKNNYHNRSSMFISVHTFQYHLYFPVNALHSICSAASSLQHVTAGHTTPTTSAAAVSSYDNSALCTWFKSYINSCPLCVKHFKSAPGFGITSTLFTFHNRIFHQFLSFHYIITLFVHPAIGHTTNALPILAVAGPSVEVYLIVVVSCWISLISWLPFQSIHHHSSPWSTPPLFL